MVVAITDGLVPRIQVTTMQALGSGFFGQSEIALSAPVSVVVAAGALLHK